MATLYEYYNTGDDNNLTVYGTVWNAQTFTPQIAHHITSVRLKLYRIGSPGTLTVSIKAVDANGHPTGADLCSGTIDGNSLTTNTAGAWYEITLSGGTALAANTKYAIVAKIVGGDASNDVNWRRDSTSPTYDRGNVESSADGGGTWVAWTSDAMFEEWGYISPSNPPTNIKVYPIPGTGVEVHATFTQANSSPAAYAQFQISKVSDFSTIYYDSGQVSISPIVDGAEGTMVFYFTPDAATTYYYRLCFWDSLNYTKTTWQVWNGTTVGTTTKTAYLRPTSDNSISGGYHYPYPASPATFFDKIDEDTHNDNTDYVYTTGSAAGTYTDYYNLSDFSDVDATIINYIKLCSYDYSNEPSPTSITSTQLGLKTHSTDYMEATGLPANSVYSLTQSSNITKNPYTSVAWTSTELNDLIFILKHIFTTVNINYQIRTTQIYIEINYQAWTFTFTGGGTLNIGFPTLLSLTKTQDKDKCTFAAIVSDAYTKPPVMSINVNNSTKLMDCISRTGSGPYIYTYSAVYSLERGDYSYFVNIGNVWTTVISDVRFAHIDYNLASEPEIKVLLGDRELKIWNPLLTDKILPDVPEIEFDTDENISDFDYEVRLIKNDLKVYKMTSQSIANIPGGYHIRAKESAKNDLGNTVTLGLQATDSLTLCKSILPNYLFFGSLPEVVYLQNFVNEGILQIFSRLLILNHSIGYARNKKIFIYDLNNVNYLYRLNQYDAGVNYSADYSTIVNKVWEYYLKKMYPIPTTSLTNYDASNWVGTVSDSKQTTNGLLPPSNAMYCLKGNGTISRTVNFFWSDFDKFNLTWAPDTANYLEIRLETDASNYHKYTRTFSGGKGAGFVLTSSTPTDTVSKTITFSAKYLSRLWCTVSQSCSYKITLVLASNIVYTTDWKTVNSNFLEELGNIQCDTLIISFTNLYPLGSSYGITCTNLRIEEYKQVYQITDVIKQLIWHADYEGNVTLHFIYDPPTHRYNALEHVVFGKAPACLTGETIEFNLNYCRSYASYGKYDPISGTYTWTNYYTGGNLVLSIDNSGNIVGDFSYSFVDVTPDVLMLPAFSYRFSVLQYLETDIGKWVWVFADYAWQSDYNLWDTISADFAQFTTVGTPTDQINTVRLIATGDNYYDALYVSKNNPSSQYVEATNPESMAKGVKFQERKLDGWSSKESASAFANAFVNLFGDPAVSYTKELPLNTDINIGDMVNCDGTIYPVYQIVYDLVGGKMIISVGRSVTDTLQFFKDTASKIEAIEKAMY